MSDCWLQCVRCGGRHDFGPRFRGCPACGDALEVRYQFTNLRFPGGGPGLWAWADWLPPVPPLSLGEGDTPLVPLPGPGPVVLVKNESRNPTWSWKDRPNAVTAAVARHFGSARLAVVSTGNHGAAAAAYAAAAGLGCVVFCHPAAPEVHVGLMRRFGAEVVRTADAGPLVTAALADGQTFPGTTLDPAPRFTNPFGVEGFKTIAFELVRQLGRCPDRVYVAVGSGDGIAGVWKGFREMKDAGVTDRLPLLVACQAAGADSLARAVTAGSDAVVPVAVDTRALSVAEPRTGDHALRAVREGGRVWVGPDDAARAAARRAGRAGLALELASALAVAAAEAERPAGDPAEVWVAVGSGAAVKWPADLP